jgi:ABC-2 type transport system ATP-binding protein
MTSSMADAVVAEELSKRYGSKWALRDCNLHVPRGRVCALVGSNGAGKTTLLQILTGFLKPTSGELRVLGSAPRQDPAWLADIGFLAQDVPLYRHMTAEQLIGMGRHLNPRWDERLARGRLEALGLALDRPVGRLSGGERAQVALALALGKRPRVLLLDEPVASLDPLARRDFLSSLAQGTAETELTVVLSSHLVADIQRVCDYLVVLSASKTQLVGDVEELLASHKVLVGPRRPAESVSGSYEVVTSQHTERQTTMLVRHQGAVEEPWWDVASVGLEELVLAYMSRASEGRRTELGAVRPHDASGLATSRVMGGQP